MCGASFCRRSGCAACTGITLAYTYPFILSVVSLGSRSTTMTPTLLGRWQIRIFLLATVGLLISLIVGLIVKNTVPLFALLYVLLFGLVWDVIYQFITSFRWD